MLERLQSELKAIQEWPCGELRTASEVIAVYFRVLRERELRDKIAELAERN